MMDLGRIPETFVLRAIQEWGQPLSERIAAVQAVLDAACFKATATTFPIFGGIWNKPCTGPEGEAATAWLKNLTGTMRRGRFQDERDHVRTEIEKRLSELAGAGGIK